MSQFLEIALHIKAIVWGPPLLILMMGVGLFLTLRLGFVQFRYLVAGLKQSVSQQGEGTGDISHFQALMTSLAGAIGTGNIVGIATAVTIGGFGALFWMWVSAFLGMATKYGEAVLAVKYRTIDERGEVAGGPMFYLDRGLGWKFGATFFALFGALAVIGTGNLVQINSVADVARGYWGVNPWVSGCASSLLTACVIVGGVKSIGRFAAVLVPIMAIMYIFAGLWILGQHASELPGAFLMIFNSAFCGEAAVGGAAGASVLMAIQMGVSRGVFSNEAGLGVSSIAAAAAKTDMPARQAIVAMSGAFISTVVVCTITGLVLAVSGVMGAADESGQPLQGASLAVQAFKDGIPGGGIIASVGLVLFAYSTIVGWAYYGEKCVEYLLSERSIPYYRVLFVLVIIPGAVMDLDAVWAIADSLNGLMSIPNLLALLALSPVIVRESKRLKELN